ncbi:cuticular protein 47Eg [Drosophila sechellia]|uniref:GM20458 n=1 Tax=Drosophila sechellia TaxID=7238 RepID=B4HND6_DROSE|nr:cuticular protein 47Eg [Drosophila sechellia]EDW47372.1 GM20458 [Drosophila sechellia]
MKFFIAFACLLAVAVANEDANILRAEQEVNVDNFKYALELDNSVNVQQKGDLNGEEWVVSGTQSWTSPEGVPVSIQYVADANGYNVVSANPPLPTPPPIPEAIQRSLEYIRAHPPKE